jgi:TetR/AcrR family transcriptional repressor of uid operon
VKGDVIMDSTPPPKVSRGRPIDVEGRNERRRQIVEAAKRCFVRKGFHAASTAEISAEAGISVAGLYQYFPSKRDLVRALVQEDLAEDLALISALQKAEDVFAGMLEVLLGFARDASAQELSRLRLEVYAEALRDPDVAELLVQSEQLLVKAVAGLIGDMQLSGHVDPAMDAEEVATSLIAFFEGMYLRISISPPNSDGFAHSAIALLRRSLLPNDPDPAGWPQ